MLANGGKIGKLRWNEEAVVLSLNGVLLGLLNSLVPVSSQKPTVNAKPAYLLPYSGSTAMIFLYRDTEHPYENCS